MVFGIGLRNERQLQLCRSFQIVRAFGSRRSVSGPSTIDDFLPQASADYNDLAAKARRQTPTAFPRGAGAGEIFTPRPAPVDVAKTSGIPISSEGPSNGSSREGY